MGGPERLVCGKAQPALRLRPRSDKARMRIHEVILTDTERDVKRKIGSYPMILCNTVVLDETLS
jgi:hypothetical protein